MCYQKLSYVYYYKKRMKKTTWKFPIEILIYYHVSSKHTSLQLLTAAHQFYLKRGSPHMQKMTDS